MRDAGVPTAVTAALLLFREEKVTPASLARSLSDLYCSQKRLSSYTLSQYELVVHSNEMH